MNNSCVRGFISNPSIRVGLHVYIESAQTVWFWNWSDLKNYFKIYIRYDVYYSARKIDMLEIFLWIVLSSNSLFLLKAGLIQHANNSSPSGDPVRWIFPVVVFINLCCISPRKYAIYVYIFFIIMNTITQLRIKQELSTKFYT